MHRQKIIFVSHCVLNTAAKVYYPHQDTPEERVRRAFLQRALQMGIQFIQLPCPEFTLYGASRWGHTREQFDNPFFRDHCRTLLAPLVQQLRAYLQQPDRFEVLGIIGIEGSPSCGVRRTCCGPWGGTFSGLENVQRTLAAVSSVPGRGVLMDELCCMLELEGLSVPLIGLDGAEPAPLYALLETDREEPEHEYPHGKSDQVLRADDRG